MTKLTKLAFLTSAVLSIPAIALADATQIDANGDGVLTIDEVQAVYPETSAEAFSAMDVNADGALDDNEVVAAQETGLMPATSG